MRGLEDLCHGGRPLHSSPAGFFAGCLLILLVAIGFSRVLPAAPAVPATLAAFTVSADLTPGD